MVVDGDPGTVAGEDAAFPPALYEDRVAGAFEPLAADPRDHADGKTLARLKLIAALLRVRLDNLRRRDLKRRRRWQATGALVLVAALTLGAITLQSVRSEQKERENAEQLASFVVELGEDLQSDVDLATLGRIGSRAMEFLEQIDRRRLSPETAIKVGLALRQLGHVNLGQDKPMESLDAFQRSLDLFRELGEKNPDRLDVLFELAQAEFYVGNYYYEQGDIGSARPFWERYLGLSTELYNTDPDNPQWQLEVSYGNLNLVLLRIESGLPADRALLEDVDTAVGLSRRILSEQPDNSEVISHYANMLAWAADAEMLACNLQTAFEYRRETLEMAQEAVRGEPSSNFLRLRLAWAHSGVARVLTDLGTLEEAESHRRASLEILGELVARDPTNLMLTSEVAENRRLLATLLMNTDRTEPAIPLMRDVADHWEPRPDVGDLTDADLNDYSNFMQAYAELLIRTGELERARELLVSQSEVVRHYLDQGIYDREVRDKAAMLRYLRYELDREDVAIEQPALKLAEPESEAEYRSCFDADMNARLAVIEGDPGKARPQVAYLQERQYRHPGFLRFCRKYQLCTE